MDHKNHNTLDNRKRSNLRQCTHAENSRNLKIRTGYSSKYKGVYWDKEKKKYRSKIRVDNKGIHLGYFDDEEIAGRTYDIAAKKYFGQFARTNF